ncbi:hypothetical protein Tco_1211533 [Tanacetum coccineum]
MARMNTRFNIKKLDENIIQKHGGSKQVGFKQLGPVPESAPRFDDDFPSIPEGVSGGNSHVTPSAPSITDLPNDGIEEQMIQDATEATRTTTKMRFGVEKKLGST